MNILVTGAKGFVGRNLCASLYNIKDGKDRTRPGLKIDEVFEYDLNTNPSLLDEFCQKADFVFNLAGVNRAKERSEFLEGNYGFASILLNTLKKYGNLCPVMLSSSIQATLDNPYGESKRAGEQLILDYSKETGAKALVYRFPNIFGKWCRPNYNSAVATFCHNIAHDLPIQVNDPKTVMHLVYIDDVVAELMDSLEGNEHGEGDFCEVRVVHEITLGGIVELIHQFHEQPLNLMMPEMPAGSFSKKLYSTYLSYLPKEKVAFPLKMNVDERGSFTEMLKTAKCGQFSVNISKPGITKGQHWHHTKWEFFIVVAGHGLVQMRNMNPLPTGEGKEEVLEYEVSGDKIEAVHILPGYTHNIINLSKTENLVTLMWANEPFDSAHPDTFYEKVKE